MSRAWLGPSLSATVVGVVLAMSAASAVATSQGAAQPYAEATQRQIKALSAEQIAGLRAGRGMGYAMPAELNGYPGPMHVLEHADALKLTAEQLQRTQTLFAQMKADAIPLGERLVREEAALDALFAGRTANRDAVAAATAAIAATSGRLRAVHLNYHLDMMQVLTPEQVAAYGRLRGYGDADGERGAVRHHHGHGHGRQH